MKKTPQDMFVGREGELKILVDSFTDIESKRTRIVLIAGEPGIGKTTLAERVTSLAASRGYSTYQGTCFGGGYSPPFWLWTQVMRSALSSGHGKKAFSHITTAQQSTIARIVPELEVSQNSDLREGWTPLHDERGRFELFDSMTRFFVRLSEINPTVIWLDDLHWADGSDLSFLEFATQQLAGARVLVLGTYRDTDVARTSPLSRTLGVLNRRSGFDRIHLDGLSPFEMEQLINGSSAVQLNSQVMSRLVERSNGNPMFGREMARSASEHADGTGSEIPLPRGIIEAVGARMDRMEDSQIGVLRTAAVIGRKFSLNVLERSLDNAGMQLGSTMDEAQRSGLISELASSPGTYRFTHSLIQETLQEELTPTQLVQTHARIAKVLTASTEPEIAEQLSAIARHYRQGVAALNLETAVDYALRAGEQALVSYSFSEAADHFEWAVESAADKSDSPLRASMLERFAVATLQTNTAEPQRAWDALCIAVRMYIRLNLNHEAVRLASFPAVVGGMTGVAELIEDALTVAAPGTAERGWLLARHVVALLDAARFDEAETAYRETVEIAEELDDERLRARAMVHGAQARYRANDPRGCASRGLQAIDLAFEVGDPLGAFRVLDFCVEALCDEGRVSDAETIIDRARQIEGVQPQQLWILFRSEALIAMYRGDWDQIDQSLAGLPDDELKRNVVNWRKLHAGFRNGEPDSSLYDRLDPSMSKWHIDGFHVAINLLATWMQVQSEPQLLKLCKQVTYDAPIVTADGEIRQRALAVLMSLQRKNTPAADDMTALQHSSSNFVPRTDVPIGRILALAESASGNYAVAHSHLQSTIELCRNAGFKPSLAWALFDLIQIASNSLEAVGLKEAKDAAKEATQIARELEMPALALHINEVMEQLQKDSAAFPVFPGGLSEREVEVLRLLTEGKSNQEIADELTISRHTVVRHLSRIYPKTGSHNRTEAVTYAHRNNLV